MPAKSIRIGVGVIVTIALFIVGWIITSQQSVNSTHGVAINKRLRIERYEYDQSRLEGRMKGLEHNQNEMLGMLGRIEGRLETR